MSTIHFVGGPLCGREVTEGKPWPPDMVSNIAGTKQCRLRRNTDYTMLVFTDDYRQEHWYESGPNQTFYLIRYSDAPQTKKPT